MSKDLIIKMIFCMKPHTTKQSLIPINEVIVGNLDLVDPLPRDRAFSGFVKKQDPMYDVLKSCKLISHSLLSPNNVRSLWPHN